MLCAICKSNKTEQRHHISYNPEMVIDICVPCHVKFHEHGVGPAKGAIKPKEAVPKCVEILHLPKFTKTVKQGKTHYIVTKNEEVLEYMRCPNGCNIHNWELYHSKKEKRFILRCFWCGYDVKFERVG